MQKAIRFLPLLAVSTTAIAVDFPCGLLPSDMTGCPVRTLVSAMPETSLPTSVDMTAQFPPIGDQGSFPSCVGWATAYAMKTQQEQRERNWGVNSAAHQFSALYVYNQIQVPQGGAYTTSALNLLKGQGCDVIAGFNPGNVATMPGSASRAAAASYKIASWNSVMLSPRLIKTLLSQGRPIILGIKIKPDFDSLSAVNQIYDNSSGYSRGNHAICLIGYDDAKQAFKLQNSWGAGWGVGGYGWISYSLFGNADQTVFEAFETVDVTAEPWFSLARWATQQGGFWDAQKWLSGDFNGDGRFDMANVFVDGGLASVDIHASNGSSFGHARWATQHGGYWDAQKWLAGDFNGDGKCDVVNIFTEGGLASLDVHASAGSYLGHARWATQQGGFWDAQKWLAGDFNGDGKCDVVNIFTEGGFASLDVHASTGSSFGCARWATQQGSFWDAQKWLAGDFNGDGRCDVVNVYNDSGLATIDVHESTGSSFGCARWATQKCGFWDAQKWLATDVNGDGKTDLIIVYNNHNAGIATIDVLLSKGSGFEHVHAGETQGVYWDAQKWLAGDFDGDGLGDIGKVFSDAGQASIDVHSTLPIALRDRG